MRDEPQPELENRLGKIEEEVARLKAKPKDRWDKAQIILAILIPASIAMAGLMVSTSLKEAEIQSATRIADGNKRLADTNVAIAQAKLIHDFLGPLTDVTRDAKKRRLLAMEAVVLALEEKGRSLVQKIEESEPAESELRSVARSILERLRNGERCEGNSSCLSGYCYPGPKPGVNYCLAVAMNCAFPGGEGYRYGDIVPFDGLRYRCYRPSAGPATWQEVKG